MSHVTTRTTVAEMDSNAQRLLLCDPAAAPRFAAALDRAIAYGADAYIERDPWRTPEQQADKVRLGLSQRLDSAHTHTTPNGKPASRAVHLVSREHFYFAHAPEKLPAFAVRICAAALHEGLVSGALYGPKGRAQAHEHAEQWDNIYAGLKLACLDERWRDAEVLFEVGQGLGACWDPMHVEWRPT